MSNRNHYLPRESVLNAMSEITRWQILEIHRNQILEEIEGLKSGWITVSKGGVNYQLQLSRARLLRVEKVGKEYGLWLHDDVAAA